MERLSDDVPDSRNMSTDDFASIALIEKEENFDPEELSPGCLSSFLQKERFHRTPPALLLSYVLFFLSVLIWISTVIQYRSIQESSQRASCSIWNPYTEVTGKDWHKVQRNNSGIPNNPWKGEPSPEIDEAWKKIWMIGAESYTYEEIERVGKDPRGVARWPQEFGGGYAAKTEIFHQLHCLNIIRKGLSPEYYGETTPARAHILHCVDKIREALMCVSDTTLKTYVWTEDSQGVQPDFSMQTMCRDFADVRAFAISRGMPEEAATAMKKSDTEFLWPHLPD